MELKHISGNKFTIVNSREVDIAVKSILNSVLGEKFNYTGFTIDQFYDKILSNYVLEYILSNKKELLDKYSIVRTTLELDTRVIHVTSGVIVQDDIEEYMSGVVQGG